jgi:hypothetical protein
MFVGSKKAATTTA